MKKNYILMAVMATFLFCTTTAMAGQQDFTLVNGSASNICFVYVSPSNSNDWESDILGKDECLMPGESVHVTFGRGQQALWDIRVEDENGNAEDYSGFNLNEISTISIQGGGEASYQ